MSNEKDSGGTAFPIIHPDGMGVQYWGISVRDYFAAKAMQGILSSGHARPEKAYHFKNIAEDAYIQADAMLEAQNK